MASRPISCKPADPLAVDLVSVKDSFWSRGCLQVLLVYEGSPSGSVEVQRGAADTQVAHVAFSVNQGLGPAHNPLRDTPP